MQEKRIFEPHFTHRGSMSNPLGWLSGITHRMVGVAPASYGFTIGKLRQPTVLAIYTLEVFPVAPASSANLGSAA